MLKKNTDPFPKEPVKKPNLQIKLDKKSVEIREGLPEEAYKSKGGCSGCQDS